MTSLQNGSGNLTIAVVQAANYGSAPAASFDDFKGIIDIFDNSVYRVSAAKIEIVIQSRNKAKYPRESIIQWLVWMQNRKMMICHLETCESKVGNSVGKMNDFLIALM